MTLHHDKEVFAELISGVSNELHIPAPVVEKDYFVTLVLRTLSQNMCNMVFRGGTSLSKCYHLLDRFSEDIDLCCSAELGEISEAQRKNLKKSIVNSLESVGFPIDNLDDIRSRRNYNRYLINYTSLYEMPSFLKSEIVIETYVALPSYPTVTLPADNYFYRFLNKINQLDLAAQYNLLPFPINTQSMDRTLVDKIFALCDYYLAGNTDRHSRHLYDIYQIYHHLKIPDDFGDLVSSVRSARAQLPLCISAKKNVSINEVLTKIIENEVYRKDYQEITKRLLFVTLPYDVAISSIKDIIDSKIFY